MLNNIIMMTIHKNISMDMPLSQNINKFSLNQCIKKLHVSMADQIPYYWLCHK